MTTVETINETRHRLVMSKADSATVTLEFRIVEDIDENKHGHRTFLINSVLYLAHNQKETSKSFKADGTATNYLEQTVGQLYMRGYHAVKCFQCDSMFFMERENEHEAVCHRCDMITEY